MTLYVRYTPGSAGAELGGGWIELMTLYVRYTPG